MKANAVVNINSLSPLLHKDLPGLLSTSFLSQESSHFSWSASCTQEIDVWLLGLVGILSTGVSFPDCGWNAADGSSAPSRFWSSSIFALVPSPPCQIIDNKHIVAVNNTVQELVKKIARITGAMKILKNHQHILVWHFRNYSGNPVKMISIQNIHINALGPPLLLHTQQAVKLTSGNF